MSRIYDNWEKLVGAVLRREKDRQLALCPSFSSLGSADVSSRPSFTSDMLTDLSAHSNIMAIPFEEIKLATQNFQPDMLLGEGRLGPVFKGWIHEHFLTAVKPGSGIAVAVKKLHEREIYYINQRHPNLVKLIGYGFGEGSSFLVYEFMPNGSLDNHLFTRGPQSLSWETRIKVAIGAARGLTFLHDMEIIVTHQWLKISSILLDDDFNPIFSDFDLAASGFSNISPLSMNDYTAPEYTTKGSLTVKSDVYSFGIVLLELLSGLRVLDHNRPMKHQNLVIWAKRYLSNKSKFSQIVDSRLEGQYPHDGAYKVGNIVSQCLSLDPKRRPSMSYVVHVLEQVQCLDTTHESSVSPCHFRNPREPLARADIDRQTVQDGSRNWVVLREGTISIERDLAGSSKFSVLGLEVMRSSHHNIFFWRKAIAIEYEEINEATRNFHDELKLGKGPFSSVYKGLIDENYCAAMKRESGIPVVVKKMKKCQEFEEQEWLDKVSQLRHPNLVTPVGYYFGTDQSIFIYEFMPKGSLNFHLIRRGALQQLRQPLPWETRIKIALGAARGLAFLHGLEGTVIFGILRSEDILLDHDFNAKLSNISPSRYGFRHGMPSVVWARYNPYAAPEYKATGHLYIKSDVYSFGVVLVELMSGIEAVDNMMEWAMPFLENKTRLSQFMDRGLKGQYPLEGANELRKIAFKCLTSHPRSRPSMAEVVAALQQLGSS